MNNLDFVYIQANEKLYGWTVTIRICISNFQEVRHYKIFKRINFEDIKFKVRSCIIDLFQLLDMDKIQVNDDYDNGWFSNVYYFKKRIGSSSKKFYDLLDIALKSNERYKPNFKIDL
jgi:pectate lyase